MFVKPRVGTRVEITVGSLAGLKGTVATHPQVPDQRLSGGKVLIRLDPPTTWSGHDHVKVHRSKVQRIKPKRFIFP
jgi:hypothetical protein